MKDRRRAAALGLISGLGAVAVLTNVAPLRPPPEYTPRITVDMLTREHARPVMLLIGDGFATASPDTPSGQTFPWRACGILQWVCNVDAQAGTGYQAGGEAATGTAPYGKRMATIRDVYLADVVVVTGGLDDGARAGKHAGERAGEYAAEYQAARRLFHGLAAAYPHAEHVAVEPFATQDRPPADVVQLRAAVQKAAAAEGFRWVDTDGWLTPGRLSPGGRRLNQAGHQAVGAKLARALQPLDGGGASGPP